MKRNSLHSSKFDAGQNNKRTEMEHEFDSQELVKCVLVGDTAVGKTRLICARACNVRTSLRQLLNTHHISTVWAIDQYRIYKDVLERSKSTVDEVQVSLRLWDTFGSANADRRFAYGHSDVILLCFSIGSKSSLQHCKTLWYPEIRRFCPDTPVILVGCKNDLRYLVRDPVYQGYCKDRSPVIRPPRFDDLIMPEQARILAKELDIPYYEASVYTYFGVDQVFENAIRAALITRRSQRFWMTNLKHVRQPLLQAPYCPPKKQANPVSVCPGTFWRDMKSIAQDHEFADVVFCIGSDEIRAHSVFLAAAKNLLQYIQVVGYSRRSSCLSTSETTTDDEQSTLLPEKKCVPSSIFAGFASCLDGNESLDEQEIAVPNPLESSILSIDYTQVEAFSNLQLRLILSPRISCKHFSAVIYFLYTGELPDDLPKTNEFLEELAETAKLLDACTMIEFLTHYKMDIAQRISCTKYHRNIQQQALWECCKNDLYTDVSFELDDGKALAHCAILMARIEFFRNMFTVDCLEKITRSVTLPGVKTETFYYFLEYAYLDKIRSDIPLEQIMLTIELANRLCLSRLVNICECLVIDKINKDTEMDFTEDYIRILEPAQLHNAENLASFCMIYLATNYDHVSRNYAKLFNELSQENTKWILENRWPPVWYIKDLDFYHKQIDARYKSEQALRKKHRKRNNSGCLCFSSSSRLDELDSEQEIPIMRTSTISST